MIRTLAVLAAGLFGIAAEGAEGPLPRRVLYVGKPASDRGREFVAFLEGHFARVESADRDRFRPGATDGVDVVILDWSQAEANGGKPFEFPFPERALESPLGPRSSWARPTVLLGSAGHLMAAPWQVHGGSGCTCMDPFAYDLRDHPVARGPIPVDRSKATRRTTPGPWSGRLKESTVEVIPLSRNPSQEAVPGWCTYIERMAGSPEVEVICGGINAKTPTAAGIWRQGNLLHFGFEPSPAEMTDEGRALLVNSIAYIARFTEDRPIVRSPSPFAAPAPEPRGWVENLFRRADVDAREWFERHAPSLLARSGAKDLPALRADFAQVRDYLRSDPEARLEVDEEARSLGVPPNTPAFFDRTLAALRGPALDAAPARVLLARYAPDGPGADAPADDWARWWAENRPYLFFSDVGGYRWYLDPLAKKRGVPTSDLRGPARADRPAPR